MKCHISREEELDDDEIEDEELEGEEDVKKERKAGQNVSPQANRLLSSCLKSFSPNRRNHLHRHRKHFDNNRFPGSEMADMGINDFVTHESKYSLTKLEVQPDVIAAATPQPVVRDDEKDE